MLFFFGVRNAVIATAPLTGVACAHCNTPDALTGTVFSRYLHLFWIPVFPIGKSSVTVCRHCKQVLTPREMPASYRSPLQALQEQARTPLTHFALLLLFGAVVAFGFLMSIFGKPNRPAAPATSPAETATSPATPAAARGEQATAAEVGARYKINLRPDGSIYCLAKVTKATPDSVHFRLTNPLRAAISDAGAALALRDSVAPGNTDQRLATPQWQQNVARAVFKRLE